VHTSALQLQHCNPWAIRSAHSDIGTFALSYERSVLGKYFFRQVFGQKYYLICYSSYTFGKDALTTIRFEAWGFCANRYQIQSGFVSTFVAWLPQSPTMRPEDADLRVFKNLLLRRSAYDHTRPSNRPYHLIPVPSVRQSP